MSVVLYLLLGALDILAILAITFKMYRWPLMVYWKELLMMATVLSLVSWLDRSVLGIEEYDALIQYLLLTAGFRYIFVVRWSAAFSLSTIGYLAFVATQNVVYSILLETGIVSVVDAQIAAGTGTYLIQFTNHLLDFTLAALLYYSGYGFSYLMVPPHEIRYRPESTLVQKLIAFANIVAAFVISSTMYWIMNYYTHVYIIVPAAVIALVILIYITNKRDYEQ